MRDITALHPRLQEKISQLQELCKKEGLELGIAECLRTAEEQDALYAQGRMEPGSIITNAKGSSYSSQHQWGIAFDFFKNVKGHAYDDDAFFERVGVLGKSIGLGWGGDWKSFKDRPHLYLPDWGSTTSKLRAEYGTPEQFMATWEKRDLIAVDGSWGKDTTTKSQMVFGTIADGIVSNQKYTCKPYCKNVSTASWNFKLTGYKNGSNLIKAIQRFLRDEGYYFGEVDGWCGKQTVTAIQCFLADRGYYTGEIDGKMGPGTVKGWQMYINSRL